MKISLRRSKPSVYSGLYKGFRRVRGPAATQANENRWEHNEMERKLQERMWFSSFLETSA